jgi:hypothetical protein
MELRRTGGTAGELSANSSNVSQARWLRDGESRRRRAGHEAMIAAHTTNLLCPQRPLGRNEELPESSPVLAVGIESKRALDVAEPPRSTR